MRKFLCDHIYFLCKREARLKDDIFGLDIWGEWDSLKWDCELKDCRVVLHTQTGKMTKNLEQRQST